MKNFQTHLSIYAYLINLCALPIQISPVFYSFSVDILTAWKTKKLL